MTEEASEKPKPKEDSLKKEKPSWWKQRTSMERSGILFLIIAVLAILALIIALAVISSQSYRSRSNNSICESSSCIEASANILKNFNKSVDPCDDFYEFACGNYLRDAVVPDGDPHVNIMSETQYLIEAQLKEIFEEPPTANEPKPSLILRNFYNSCTNTSALDKNGLASFRALFRNLNGWPIMEGNNWNQNNFEWKESMYNFRRFGLNADYFMKVSVQPMLNDTTQLLVDLDRAELGTPRKTLLSGSEADMKAEYNFLFRLAGEFGAHKPIAEYDVRNVLEFRRDLAKISLSEEERRNKTALYNPMTIEELQRKYPNIYWLEFLNKVVAIPDRNLNITQIVNVKRPQYITDLLDLLRRTSIRVQANHAIFQFLSKLEPYLPETIRSKLFQEPRDPRWRECVKLTSKSFDLASTALYARKHIKNESKEKTLQLASDIKEELVKVLEERNWMNNSAKEKAVKRAKDLQIQIGYRDEWLTNEKLENYYSELWVTSGNLLQSMVNISVFKSNKDVERLGKLLDQMDWMTHVTPIDTKVIYSNVENILYLPMGLVQSALLTEDNLQSMRYGSLGYYIAYQLTHEFDNAEEIFNKNSSSKDSENSMLQEQTKCIMEQYNKNYESNSEFDDMDVLSETAAGSAGVKESYLAYNTWVDNNGPEETLPGLKNTPKQLFWISVANLHCTKYSKGMSSNYNRFRITSALSNSRDFADDFQCPSGSKMNPTHKCNVW